MGQAAEGRTPRRARRRIGAAVYAAGAVLLALLAYLLATHYRAVRSLREDLLQQRAQHVHFHAAALAHALGAAAEALRNAGESREVQAYFESRDLGMSMRYGLGLTIFPIEQRLADLTAGKADGAPAPFRRVALVDEEGRPVADVGEPGAAPPAERLGPGEPGGPRIAPGGGEILVLRPHLHKGRRAGLLVGWLSRGAVAHALQGLVPEPGAPASLLVQDLALRTWRPAAPLGSPLPEGLDLVALPGDGRAVELAAAPGGGRAGLVGVRSPVPGQSLWLVHVEEEGRLLGDLSPGRGILFLSLASALVLLALGVAVSGSARAEVLRARLEEARRGAEEVARKHRDLEREVAERRRLEAAHARLAMAVEQVAEAIVVTDPAGAFTYVNPAFERMTGYGAEAIRGASAALLDSGENAGATLAEVVGAVAGGGGWKGELSIRRSPGDLLEVEVVISPMRGAAGEVLSFVAVGRDVTEVKRLREGLRHAQKLEAVGTLAAGVAHDFNNLLAVILGSAGAALEAAPEDPALREDLGEIQRAGQRAAELTRKLLAFGRRQVLRPEVVDLDEVVSGLQRMLRRLIPESIELEAVAGPGVLRPVVDPGQLEQVIVNLVVNARDAMPRGGRITLSTDTAELDAAAAARYPEGAPGTWARLTVTDTGTGMGPVTLGRIFEPFFTTKEPGKGTGLGLATVYGIVRQSRGFIGVTSVLGVGTTFEIFLPGEAAAALPVAAARARPTPAPGRGKGEVALVVEDDAQLRRLLQGRLQAAGFTVLAAADGREALEVDARHGGQVDLLLSDVVMPRMNGPELARTFRARHPRALVVFMTGYAGDETLGHPEVRAAAAVLAKPADLDGVAGTLRRLLEDAGRRGAA